MMTPAVSCGNSRSSAKSSRLTLAPALRSISMASLLHGVKPRHEATITSGPSESRTVPPSGRYPRWPANCSTRSRSRRCSMSATISVTSPKGGTFATPGAGESHVRASRSMSAPTKGRFGPHTSLRMLSTCAPSRAPQKMTPAMLISSAAARTPLRTCSRVLPQPRTSSRRTTGASSFLATSAGVQEPLGPSSYSPTLAESSESWASAMDFTYRSPAAFIPYRPGSMKPDPPHLSQTAAEPKAPK
ncbi:MAG: hypothetical protein BWY79_00571 [Actinobacteria bacterium ADurb.Bin444]|nr:MAG: hypothetical protein BWY79_00571 [Actinobacteria bacterium ADurb.Bin444]